MHRQQRVRTNFPYTATVQVMQSQPRLHTLHSMLTQGHIESQTNLICKAAWKRKCRHILQGSSCCEEHDDQMACAIYAMPSHHIVLPASSLHWRDYMHNYKLSTTQCYVQYTAKHYYAQCWMCVPEILVTESRKQIKDHTSSKISMQAAEMTALLTCMLWSKVPWS